MPWELLSDALRKRYGLMWHWMKQTTVDRLRVSNLQIIVTRSLRQKVSYHGRKLRTQE
jgi:hypothetical protein